MFARALAALFLCVAVWVVALGLFVRYGGPMSDKLSKFVSWKSFGAAVYISAPALLHALVPRIPLELCEAATAFIAVHLLHMAPPVKVSK